MGIEKNVRPSDQDVVMFTLSNLVFSVSPTSLHFLVHDTFEVDDVQPQVFKRESALLVNDFRRLWSRVPRAA